MFFYRPNTLRPFDVKIPPEMITIGQDDVTFDSKHKSYQKVKSQLEDRNKFYKNIIEVEYVGVFSYLYGIVELGKLFESMHQTTPNKKFILYLACAVSDFYLPKDQMAEHKMQCREAHVENSSKPGLTLTLANTPKTL